MSARISVNESQSFRATFKDWGVFWDRYGVLAILIVFIIAASLIVPNFFRLTNFVNVMRNMAFVSFVAYGQTLVILSGGLDLSHGSLVSLSCMGSAALAVIGYPWLGVLAALGIGLFCGMISGTVIGLIRLNPIIATLGMMYLAGGLSSFFTDGKSIVDIDYEKVRLLHFLADGEIFHIPIILILSLIWLIFIHYLLRHTRFGNHLYALGGDEVNAQIVGINYAKMKFIIFSISGISCGIAGALLMGRTCTGEPKVGFGTFILESVGAVVIGGNDIFGGTGTVGKTFLGLLILAFLSNSLNLFGISTFMQEILIGIVVLTFCYLRLIRQIS